MEKWLCEPLVWEYTLSNSGNILKLLISNQILKYLSSQINNLVRVISQKICENKMDNRGSKSATAIAVAVKEQRVDGSGQELLINSSTCLRCTLTGFERNCQINNISKQIYKRFFSSINTNKPDHTELNLKMNPWFFTGFADGEASFILYIQKTSNTKIGWATWVGFEINISDKDLSILKDIKSYLGIGKINQKSDGSCVYYIRSFKEIKVLLDHFKNYPLLTQKFADYLLFKSAFEIIEKKEHLTPEGFNKILALRASMNKGLPPKLKEAFPNITPVVRPSVLDSKVWDPNWLAGFTTAEGCFLVRIIDKPDAKPQVRLEFKLIQHIRDEQFIRSLVDYLNYGKIYIDERSVVFIVTKFSDINEKLIPFFGKYPIQGIKQLNYLDFVKVSQLIYSKLHLTSKGVKLISKIKSGMNSGRL
uniref:Homing endonuclease LAGLIDADG domain-containing protein n=3 Tax=Ceratocystis TaxID=5157 RepID=A0A5C1V9I7_9PEZI|nr:hypothetical protein I510_mgp46 [Ceratocystis cacaofunesta]YP_009704184.1 hypothetical protein [Ceratocystis fimbriata]YP_009710336.1 hypothetical protein [Ceratocystis albifundus]AFO38101.1 hypothetical protein [Ceratocystis cacaofunesta]QEN73747.1 hypothetical protein [Ceratocystis fimbriata]QFX74838.1 hypothetical protein [Ceratocystis albifundus]WPM94707.1 hypothetical protein [Ceratocystis fimbriata]WPM94759.1 hypothetical protein [Ceratocystis fimbriata]